MTSSPFLTIIAANRPAGDHAAAVKTAYLLAVINKAVLSLVDPSFVYWATADMPANRCFLVGRADSQPGVANQARDDHSKHLINK